MWKFKKTSGRSPGRYPFTPEDMKHAGWCIRKAIKIAIVPHWEGSSEDWKVELNINNKIHLDPAIYSSSEAHKKMYKYYKYYYDKYNKNNK